MPSRKASADARSDVVLITGAEVVASWNAAARTGTVLDWPEQLEDMQPGTIVGSNRAPNPDMETAAGLWGPVYFYALIAAPQARAAEVLLLPGGRAGRRGGARPADR
ncbi:hypothetical protein AB4305_17945 [Nocardia sp. 2YAB30]|uniref:hypothetical protein n=1 Tax=unclassified Nocardia TaxID=2637762 RepID=UPI003F955D26